MAKRIECRCCGSSDCEHGDHCGACGCPVCGFPGALAEDSSGRVRGFCSDCEWEARPGARASWRALQPHKTSEQIYREMMQLLGAGSTLSETDEVGAPIYGRVEG